MYLNSKNILICIIVIIVVNMSFTILLNIYKNEYIKEIVKSDSQQTLKDYIAYNDLNIVLKKYIDSIQNNEYGKLNDMSLFYARKSNNEYNELKNKLQLTNNYSVVLDEVYVLERNIYKCKFNIKTGDSLSKDYVTCIKVDSENKYFRVLDFII